MTVSLVPASIGLKVLSDDEQSSADRLLKRLTDFQDANERQRLYYEAAQAVRDLGIAIPPHLRNLEAAIGWPAMAVDVLNERLRHDGWIVPGGRDLGIAEMVAENKLNREFRVGHRAAMKYGIAFGVAGAGGRGEPNPLITVEPPTRMTATWDRRRKGVSEALLVSTDDRGITNGATLWTQDSIVELSYRDNKWELVDRSQNRMRRPPVVRLVNRYDESAGGRSEITKPMRAYTDNAVRTIVAMEVSRDFHAAPKFWLLGADEKSFQDADGNTKSAWETYIGRLNAIGRDEQGELPTIEQFQGASPQPFVEQLRVLAQLVSAESALPISYLGLVHDANPASADAALVGEARLNIRAEERMDDFGEDEGELIRMGLWIRDGRDPGVTPRPDWRPAATPTLSAAADAASKLVGAGVLPPQSEVTQKRVGLSEADRAQLADERRRERGERTLTALAAAAEAARTDPVVVELSDRRDPA